MQQLYPQLSNEYSFSYILPHIVSFFTKYTGHSGNNMPVEISQKYFSIRK